MAVSFRLLPCFINLEKPSSHLSSVYWRGWRSISLTPINAHRLSMLIIFLAAYIKYHHNNENENQA